MQYTPWRRDRAAAVLSSFYYIRTRLDNQVKRDKQAKTALADFTCR
jgi:hypothetical protein